MQKEVQGGVFIDAITKCRQLAASPPTRLYLVSAPVFLLHSL